MLLICPLLTPYLKNAPRAPQAANARAEALLDLPAANARNDHDPALPAANALVDAPALPAANALTDALSHGATPALHK